MRTVRPPLAIALVTVILSSVASAGLPGPDFDRPDRWFDDHVYHHHADLTTELEQMRSDHPHYVDLTSIGTSVRGRELWTVRITDPSVPADGKYQVYIDGEHHGDELLGGELCLLLLHHLLEDRDDARVQEVLKDYIIWVTPMLNPDGNARDRRGNANGVDLNRNYPFAHRPGGSRGDGPASEPEVRANVEFMASLDLDLYITMHTGIVRLVHPWSYIEGPTPDQSMYDNLTELSESHGITYGQASQVLYVAMGTAKDFGYGALGVPSFTYEVDDEQSRQITYREDIASRLSDELDLLMDLILVTPCMRANLEGRGAIVEPDGSGLDVSVQLENVGLTPANNTTVTVEAWSGPDMVGTATATLDVPSGDSGIARVRLDLDEGTYTLRTIVEYPKRLQDNSTLERMLLERNEATVEGSFLGAPGGWGVGVLLLLIALGAAVLYWAYQKGWWRPGMVYGKVMAKVRPQPEA